jgi:hypothetical protein
MGNPVNLVDPAGLFALGLFQIFGGLFPVFDEITVTSSFRELDTVGFLNFLGASGFLFNLDAITNGIPEIGGRITSGRLNNLANAGNSFAMIATGRADLIVGPGPLPAFNPLEFGVAFGVSKLMAARAVSSITPVGGAGRVVVRTTRTGSSGVRITRPNGSVIDITQDRVKEFVRNTHPNAPPGALQRVKFRNAQPGSKGFKRNPTSEDLKLLEASIQRK